jgi:hypothetical protein
VEVGREKRGGKEKNEEDKSEERSAGFVSFFFSNSTMKTGSSPERPDTCIGHELEFLRPLKFGCLLWSSKLD